MNTTAHIYPMDFAPITIEHKALFDAVGILEPSRNAGYSFGNVFLWDLLYRRNVAWLGDRIAIEYEFPQGVFYAYPAGRGPLEPAVGVLRDRAEHRGRPLEFRGVTPDQRTRLEEAFPGRFSWTEDRDNYDYIYDIHAFADLSGKKLHGKRNFCNRFEREHHWRFEPLVPDHFADCLALLEEWDEEHTQDNMEEQRAIARTFQFWDRLNMLGGVLYAGEAPVAFTIGETLTPDTVDVHFEKASNRVLGAYPMVAREFARHLSALNPGLQYLNREEDMGIENLRIAKEEWYPLFLLEKYTAVWSDP